jgi:hypothetical protein
MTSTSTFIVMIIVALGNIAAAIIAAHTRSPAGAGRFTYLMGDRGWM